MTDCTRVFFIVKLLGSAYSVCSVSSGGTDLGLLEFISSRLFSLAAARSVTLAASLVSRSVYPVNHVLHNSLHSFCFSSSVIFCKNTST